MSPQRRFSVPLRRRELGNYRRPCDRCGWDGWTRNQLSREPETELLVCRPCLDTPVENKFDIIDLSDGLKIRD